MSVEQVITVWLHDDGTYDVSDNDLRRPVSERRPTYAVNSLDKRGALEAVAKALDKQPLR